MTWYKIATFKEIEESSTQRKEPLDDIPKNAVELYKYQRAVICNTFLHRHEIDPSILDYDFDHLPQQSQSIRKH